MSEKSQNAPPEDFVVSDTGPAPREPDKYTRKDPQISTTQPAEVVRHNISDEQLDMLCESRSDYVWEFLMLGAGGVVGTAPTGISAYFEYAKVAGLINSSSDPVQAASKQMLPFSDFVSMIFFSVFVCVSIVVFIIHASKRKRSVDLRTEIRRRTNSKDGF